MALIDSLQSHTRFDGTRRMAAAILALFDPQPSASLDGTDDEFCTLRITIDGRKRVVPIGSHVATSRGGRAAVVDHNLMSALYGSQEGPWHLRDAYRATGTKPEIEAVRGWVEGGPKPTAPTDWPTEPMWSYDLSLPGGTSRVRPGDWVCQLDDGSFVVVPSDISEVLFSWSA